MTRQEYLQRAEEARATGAMALVEYFERQAALAEPGPEAVEAPVVGQAPAAPVGFQSDLEVPEPPRVQPAIEVGPEPRAQRDLPPFIGAQPTPTAQDRARGRDIPSSYDLERLAAERYRQFVDYYTGPTQGIPLEEAERRASAMVYGPLGQAVDVEGTVSSPTTGLLGTLLPFTRESRLVPGSPGFVRDEETGDVRPATTLELLVEPMARQTVVQPEERQEIQEQRQEARAEFMESLEASPLSDVGVQERYRQYLEEEGPVIAGLLTEPEVGGAAGPGRVVETPTGAAFRYVLNILPTLVSAGIRETPLTYEVVRDEDGNLRPADPESLGYRIAATLQQQFPDYMKQDRLLPTELLEEYPSGDPRLASALLGLNRLPRPFQPIETTAPTAFDPEGRRTIETTGRFLVDLSQSQAVGRGLGDMAASLPLTAFPVDPLEERDTKWYEYAQHPFTAFTVMEALLPTTGARTVGKGLARGAQAGARAARGRGATRLADTLTVASNPLEYARAQKTARRALLELDGVAPEAAERISGLDAATVRAQAAAVVADEVAGPAALDTAAAQLRANGVATVPRAALDALTGNPHVAKILDDLEDASGMIDVADMGRRTQAWRETWEAAEVLRLVEGGADAPAIARHLEQAIPGWNAGESVILRLVAANPDPRDLRRVLEAARMSLGSAARAPSPTLRRALALADQVKVLATRAGEAGAPRGPLARRFLRALTAYNRRQVDTRRAVEALARTDVEDVAGELRAAGVTLEGASPDAVEFALRSAIGEDVASTLLDAVPDDMVLVARSLLVPRAALEDGDVLRVVGAASDDILKSSQAVTPDGVVTTYLDNIGVAEAYANSVSPLYIRQSRTARQALEALRSGTPLDMAQRAEVEDSIRAALYRLVLEARGVTVLEPTTGGRQLQRALVPRERRGGFRDALRAGADLVGGFTPRPVRRAAEAVFPDSARRWFKGADPDRTPAPLYRALSELRETIPTVGDRFMEELATEAKRAPNPEEGFNVVLERRQARTVSQVFRELEDEVAQLQAAGMSEADAWFQVGYQARESYQAGRGIYRVQRPRNAEELAELQRLTRDAVSARPYRQSWESILRSFFGSVYDAGVAPHLDEVILRPEVARLDAAGRQAAAGLGSSYRPITTGDLRDVLELLRQRAPDTLRDRGVFAVDIPAGVRALFARKASGPLQAFLRDDLFRTLSTWALESDRGRHVRRAMDELLDTHPELRVDLSPGLRTQFTTLYPSDAGNLSTLGRSTVIERLREAIEASDMEPEAYRAALLDLEALRIRSLDPTDPLFSMFDTLAQRLVVNLSPSQRAGLVDELLRESVAQQTLYPDVGEIYSRTLGQAEALQKQATYERVGRILDAATVRDFPDLPPDLRFDDLMDYVDPGGAGTQRVHHLKAATVIRDVAARARMDEPVSRVSDELRRILGRIRGAEQEARQAGLEVERFNAVDALANAYMDGILGLQGRGLLEGPRLEVANQLRAYGLTGLATMDSGAGDYLIRAANALDPTDRRLLVYGPEAVETVRSLRSAAESGKLRQTLDELLKARGKTARSAGAMALGVLDHALSMPRTVAATGALAMGFAYVFPFADEEGPGLPFVVPMPNTRYLGMNLLTAPLIMLTTLGAGRTLRTLTDTTGARTLVDAITPRSRTETVFTAADGRRWTWGELSDAMDTANIHYSRADVEWSTKTAREMQRAARLTAEGAPVGMARTVARHLDPRSVNPFMSLATATDGYFRRNAFASALREGYSIQEAAGLARNAVLDYGAVPGFVKQYVNRYVLFATFRMAMLDALAEGLARDASTFTRVMRLQMRQQQAANAWLYGPDYTKVRAWAFPGPEIEGTATGFYGPANPAAEQANDVLNVLAYLAQADRPGRLQEAIRDERLIPAADVLLARPSSRVGPQGYMDPSYISYMQYHDAWFGTGMWPWFRDHFQLEALPEGRKYPGAETADYGRQYRFGTPEKAVEFEKLKSQAFIMAGRRAVEDGAKIGQSIQAPLGFDPKRRGLANPLLFIAGAETPMKGRAPEELVGRALETAERRIPQAPRQ
jgi:hypothetical protein